MVCMLSNVITEHRVLKQHTVGYKTKAKMINYCQERMSCKCLLAYLLRKVFFDNVGGPFDLMSRRMVSANNRKIADRIIKEIEVFDVTRDDAPVQK